MRAWQWVVAGAFGGALVLPMAANAQTDAVLLEIRPRPGDTLRVRLDQTVDITGTVRGASQAQTSETSTLVVLTRLYVEDADASAVTILAHTDSVRLTSPANTAAGSMLAWARTIQGQRFRFRVAKDGSTMPVGTHGWGKSQAGLLAQMPATLPQKPIAPGETWSSAMDVPLGTGGDDGRGTATLTATFRFDSLSRSGELAFLSVRGRLIRSSTSAREGVASIVESSGSVTGHVLVDRRRGWITEARTTVLVRSLVIPADRGRPPMRVEMTISQWLRVM